MATDLKVNDRVKDLKSDAFGRVASVQIRRVRELATDANGPLYANWRMGVMVTVRLETAGMYGDYADLPLEDLILVE